MFDDGTFSAPSDGDVDIELILRISTYDDRQCGLFKLTMMNFSSKSVLHWCAASITPMSGMVVSILL